jgi:hypothetical protein
MLTMCFASTPRFRRIPMYTYVVRLSKRSFGEVYGWLCYYRIGHQRPGARADPHLRDIKTLTKSLCRYPLLLFFSYLLAERDSLLCLW